MKKKEINTIATSTPSYDDKYIYLQGNELKQAAPLVHSKSIRVGNATSFTVKYFRKLSDAKQALLLRVSIYNHTGDSPSSVLIQGWVINSGANVTFNSYSSNDATTAAGGVGDDGYLFITIGVHPYSYALVEDMSDIRYNFELSAR